MKCHIEIKGIDQNPITYKLKDGRLVTITDAYPHKAPTGVVKGKMQFANAIGGVIGSERISLGIDDKPELMDKIQAQKLKKEDLFISRYPGMEKLLEAREGETTYQENFSKMMEDENNDGVNPPQYPKITYADAKKLYPAAHAYIIILSYSDADPSSKAGFEKRCCGGKAIAKLTDKCDVVKIKNEMVEEYKAVNIDNFN